MTACAAREAAVKGEEGSHQLLPTTSEPRHELPAPGGFCGERAGGGRLQPWTWPWASVTLLATGIPLLLQSAFLLCLTCFMVMGSRGQWGSWSPYMCWRCVCGMPSEGDQRHPLECSWKGQSPRDFLLERSWCWQGEHYLGCKCHHYLCRIFLPSGLWEQQAVAGSSRQRAQGPGEEAERDKESVSWPYMAPTALCLSPGLALSVLRYLRPRGFMGSL